MDFDFSQFVVDLLNTGRVVVLDAGQGDIDQSHRAAAEAAVRDFEKLYRLEMPGEPPVLDTRAAMWAAEMLFRVCQMVPNRLHDEESIVALLSSPAPSPESPANIYSVDLFFRFLPSTRRIAKTASESDPLLDHLDAWGKAYPLSSVGMDDCEAEVSSAILSHPTLLRLYCDRVLQADDDLRLKDPIVRQQIELAVGEHENLKSTIGRKLRRALCAEEPACATNSIGPTGE